MGGRERAQACGVPLLLLLLRRLLLLTVAATAVVAQQAITKLLKQKTPNCVCSSVSSTAPPEPQADAASLQRSQVGSAAIVRAGQAGGWLCKGRGQAWGAAHQSDSSRQRADRCQRACCCAPRQPCATGSALDSNPRYTRPERFIVPAPQARNTPGFRCWLAPHTEHQASHRRGQVGRHRAHAGLLLLLRHRVCFVRVPAALASLAVPETTSNNQGVI